MQRLRRIEGSNHARFLTFSCYDRLPLFGNAAIRDRFAHHLIETRRHHKFHLIAWVVMPEHVHLLLWPRLPVSPVSRILRSLKQHFARAVIERWRELDAPVLSRLVDSRGMTRFWQRGGGYDRNVYSDDELREKVDYIHNNPVTRGLVERPEDWAWSSARWYAGERDVAVSIDPVSRPA